jgi:hypothetical protein
MRRFSVAGRVFWITVCFDQYEAGGIILLLNKIEPDNSRFLEAIFGVIDSKGFELIDGIRFNVGIDKNYEHNVLLFNRGSGRSRKDQVIKR